MIMPFYHHDPYARSTVATVIAHTPEGGVIAAPELFYPQGGGQPGDSGRIIWPGGRLTVATTVKDTVGRAVMLPAEPAPLPPVGAEVTLHLDWPRRFAHMRMHTALHLLSVVIPLPVTGGQVGASKGRLDFDMPEPPDSSAALQTALDALIDRDLPVSSEWISDAELAANPGLVKTMAVQPPTGQGQVRLVRIGTRAATVDLQPCGGTHVARTGEIGAVAIGRIKKKGRLNRRVHLLLADAAS